ncbi:MAG: glycosyl transferase family 1 [Kordiimonas sp.]|nr:glycosyl transferase family 1 [Kordiimonas sp.]
MLQIDDLTYHIAGRGLFEKASAVIPTGHKVGIVGRNGAGKSTLFQIIMGNLSPDGGSVKYSPHLKLGMVAQEAPSGSTSLLQTVLSAHSELQILQSQADKETDPERIADIYNRLADINAQSAEARAAAILSGLGFSAQAQKRPCSDFSGGWRMRVALASILFTEPDFLLLDEPTNYLDLEGVLWLEQFIRKYRHTVLIISHDRDLLNSAVNGILHVHEGKLSYSTGGYNQFEASLAEQQRQQATLKARQDLERARIQTFVDRFRAKASKAKQVQSRVKALERMTPIASIVAQQTTPFQFPEPGSCAPPLMKLDNVSVGYEERQPVLEKVNLRLDPEDRIALLGANGNGKSTLAKLLAGRLNVQSGEYQTAPKLTVGYFAQHQVDELNLDETAYNHLRPMMPLAKESEVRARLGQFGFSADKADTIVSKLSGGEKARLLFALMSFEAPQVMILDEPTNHLDIDSREALVLALNEYPGAVILISHDRHLLEACVNDLWVVEKGSLHRFEGSLEDYRQKILRDKNDARQQKVTVFHGSDDDKKSRHEKRKENASQRQRLSPLKKAVEAAESEVTLLSEEKAKYDRALSNPRLYDPDNPKAQEAQTQFIQEQARLESALEVAEEKWLAALAALEEVEAQLTK